MNLLYPTTCTALLILLAEYINSHTPSNCCAAETQEKPLPISSTADVQCFNTMALAAWSHRNCLTNYGWLGQPLRGPTDGCIDAAAHTLSRDVNMYRIMPRAARYTWMLPSRTVLAVNAFGCHELNMLPVYTYMDFAYSSLFFSGRPS